MTPSAGDPPRLVFLRGAAQPLPGLRQSRGGSNGARRMRQGLAFGDGM